jgi:hypothetical protein
MPLTFDATLKELVVGHLPDYEAALRLPATPHDTLLNVDLSAVTAATDIAIGHGEPPQRVSDLNFQSGPDADFDARVLLYAALLHYRYRVPIHSVAVLLRPEADSPEVLGRVRFAGQRRRSKMDFKFDVVRMWQQPVGRFLRGGLGTLPLATLCRLPPAHSVAEALPDVIHRIDRRLLREATPEDARQLLTATYLLTGLRVSHEVVDALFERLTHMHESSTFQKILEDGQKEALRDTVLRQGRIRFGPPDERVTAAVQAVNDLARLRRWTERVLSASTWDELLKTR